MVQEGRGRPGPDWWLLQAQLLPHRSVRKSLRPAFMQVLEYSRAMGLDMIQGDHEDAPGQLELNWIAFDDVLQQHADRLATYRQICGQVAREHGLIACFMSKPYMGVSASGCHHNVSLWSRRRRPRSTSSATIRCCLAWMAPSTYMDGGEEPLHAGSQPSKQRKKPGPVGLQLRRRCDGAPRLR